MTDNGNKAETNKEILQELKKSKKFRSKKSNIVFFMLLSFIPILTFAYALSGLGLPEGIGLIGLVGVLFGINAWIKEDKVKKAALSKGLSHIDSELREKAESYKTFFIVNVVLWILFIFAAIIIPGMSSPRIAIYDKECIEALNEIAIAQDSYFRKKNAYTSEQKDLAGFTLPQRVKLKELIADEKCWRASVFHDIDNDRRSFTFESCNGGLISEEPELSEKN